VFFENCRRFGRTERFYARAIGGVAPEVLLVVADTDMLRLPIHFPAGRWSVHWLHPNLVRPVVAVAACNGQLEPE
jgi:hypothetical protein